MGKISPLAGFDDERQDSSPQPHTMLVLECNACGSRMANVKYRIPINEETALGFHHIF
jgi:hypothetical protein